MFPYKRPMSKDGFIKKYEYVYDKYFDCYICPNNKALRYSTINRGDYREYKSCPEDCLNCTYLNQCTESKIHTEAVTLHIWDNCMEQCEGIGYTKGNKEMYEKRKETIERLFCTAKKHHGFRYTQMIARLKWK